MIRTVTVFASSSDSLHTEFYREAAALGTLLAQKNIAVVYGGGNNGLMGSLAENVFRQNGTLTGVITRPLKEMGFCFEQASEIIETETLDTRKQIMEEKADAYIILPGGIGTMDELFNVLSQKQLGYHDKPVILINTMGFFDKFVEWFAVLTELRFTSKEDNLLFRVAENATAACSLLNGE